MSSQNTNERQLLESLQEEYRRAWHNFQLEMSLLADATKPSDATKLSNATNQLNMEQSVNTRARADRAAAQYREARNSLASFLLAENPQDDESAYAIRLANVVARAQAA